MRPSDYMQRNPVRLTTSRSKFNMSPRWTGTLKSYELAPIFTYIDILPGDTFKLDASMVCRMATPVVPVMDDLFLDVSFYWVPHDLILSRSYMSPSTNDSNHSFKAFIGAQDSFLNMPVPDSTIQLPYMLVGYGGYQQNGLADNMGLIYNSISSGSGYKINALAPLAFMAVWNENYREPNTQNPGVFSIVNNAVQITWAAAGLSSDSQWGDAVRPNVCRFHGYFGSSLPWPQRNSTSVLLPLGSTAPIITGNSITSFGSNNLMFRMDGNIPAGYAGPLSLRNDSNASQSDLSARVGVDSSLVPTAARVIGSNMVADLANASAVSINTFRLAVQEQRWYEALARGGNRFDELTASMFGVMQKDAGAGQPEYLGGKRIPIQVSQVNVTANSSSGSANNSVGNTGAFSLTSDSDHYFTKSFDRWGSIIGVACVRYRDSYGASLNRMFTRHNRFDFYWPQFANLGEQPVYKHELSASEMTSNSFEWPESTVFGYQEAWAEYRVIPDIVTGAVRPGGSLDHWTYANNFSAVYDSTVTGVTTLAGYLAGTNALNAVDRTLQVASSSSGLQFLLQFQFDITAVRPMPMYSIPGLVDHN